MADLLPESGDLEILPVDHEGKLLDPVLTVFVQLRELGRYIRRCARCRLWLAAPLSGGDDLPGLRIELADHAAFGTGLFFLLVPVADRFIDISRIGIFVILLDKSHNRSSLHRYILCLNYITCLRIYQ